MSPRSRLSALLFLPLWSAAVALAADAPVIAPWPTQDVSAGNAPEAIVHGGSAARAASLTPGAVDEPGGTAPPAWAARQMVSQQVSQLLPFGANLFQGNFSGGRSTGFPADYKILPGDQISFRIWGTRNHESTQVVDHQGNIFIPEIGPVQVGGVAHGRLNDTVREKIQEVYPDGLSVYTNLISAQPMAVYVAGFANKPGRYAGLSNESILSYLDRAGGIMHQRGSFRRIMIVRGGEEIAEADLYDFLRQGVLPPTQLEENDVILVKERGPSVAVLGDLHQPARYEYPPVDQPGVASFSGEFSGRELTEMASPMASAAFVSISGSRQGRPFNSYLSREEFASFRLADNDVVEFLANRQTDNILITVTGEVTGNERFPVRKGTTLATMLAHIAVNPATADTNAIYLRRRSVAEQQRMAIHQSLQRLEQTALTATASTPAEVEIRLGEAKMIQEFVRRARLVEPNGVVVVRQNNQTIDLLLEDGDIIVVPPKRQTVQVSGEVMLPKVVAFQQGAKTENYIAGAGGFLRRAERREVLVVRPNGEVERGRSPAVNPGDHIIVLPRYETRNLLLAQSITQIIYQIAVAARVAVSI